MELDAEIMHLADGMQEELTRQRRDLHQHPEPGWTEFRTASIVAKTLTELGWEVHTGREVMEENARMGVPSPDVLAREKERAAREGADPQWLDKMDGGFTGVVGVLHCGAGPVVGLRFDMDSNDVTETDAPEHFPNREGFASCHPRCDARVRPRWTHDRRTRCRAHFLGTKGQTQGDDQTRFSAC